MKFQRNVRIFRGQMDAAPLAGIVFLVLMFVTLHSSLVYTPGVRVELRQEADLNRVRSPRRVVQIDAKGRFNYENQVFKESTFAEKLQDEVKHQKDPRILVIRADPGVKPEMVERVRNLAFQLGIKLQTPHLGVELPEGPEFFGTDRPSVVLAIPAPPPEKEFQQYFFQNQVIKPSELGVKLQAAKAGSAEPLTLILEVDKDVPLEVIVEVCRVARGVGIVDAMWAVRPQLSPFTTNRLSGP